MTDFLPTLPIARPTALPRLTLRRLLLMMVLLAVLPMLLVEWRSYRLDVGEQEQRAGERLEVTARLLAATQRQTLQGVDQLLSVMALSPQLTTEDDRMQCQTQIEQLQRQFPETYISLGLTDAQGYLACRSGEAALQIYQGHLPYFQRVLSQRRMALSLVAQDRLSNVQTLLLAQPVLQAGRPEVVRGMVFAALDLAAQAQELHALGEAVPGQRLQVFTTEGQLLASSDASRASGEVNQMEAPLQDAAARHSSRWLQWTDREGRARLGAVQVVTLHQQPALVVVASTPVTTVHAPLLQSMGQRVGVLLLIALAVGAVVWQLGDRLMVQPIQRLVQGLARIEQSDYTLSADPLAARWRELALVQQSLASLVLTLDRQRDERTQVLAALRAREADYRQLFAHNPQVMYVYDADSLCFLDANEAALDYYGYSHAELLERTLLDIRPDSEHVLLLGYVSHRREAQPAPEVWLHCRRNGELRHVEVIARTVMFEGRGAQLEMVTDVTELVALREREREAHERLEQRVALRTQELKLSNQELEAFAYSVSHDLRNPLGAVAMFTQLLSAQLGENQDEQARHCIQRILQGVHSMEHLIDDLMVLSQVTRRPLDVGPVDLSALAREHLAQLQEREPQRQVEVVVEDGLLTRGDGHLLRQLMVNLIDNAWKFTGRTPAPRIRVGSLPQPAGTPPVYVVEDNGAGFDMQFAHRLFLPFERLHGDQEFPGTGVGLAIVQRVVRRHGGQIWAQAQVRQGARFHFTLIPPELTA